MDPDATRQSLIERLPDWEDRARWQEFFDTYRRLIHGVARKAGLTEAEAQDVVQETVLGVAKNIARFDPKAGSFKGWLMQLTRWRIIDQLRKRSPADATAHAPHDDDSHRDTAPIDRIADPAGAELADTWEEEWRRTILDAALDRLRRKVNAKHFQIFDCAVVKKWPPSKVAAELRVSVAQVYLVKHRIAAQLKREVAALEAAG